MTTTEISPKEDKITHYCNLINIASQYGYTPKEDLRELARKIIVGETVDDTLLSLLTNYDNTRKVFIKNFAATLKPLLFGIGRKWKKTQEELLRATLHWLENGYVRLLSEVPTGGGKSMFIGALVRAALDTMNELGLDQEIHIFTSRIAIAGQLIYEEFDMTNEESASMANDRPLELGKKGDVRMWCPELKEEEIRLLAGKLGSSKLERSKNARLTVSTYQGLNAKRIAECFTKQPFLVICDESHRVTERVEVFIDQMPAMVFGVSATVLGPQRDPFDLFFERIHRPELELVKKTKTYVDYLCYYKSIAEMIKDQELKPVRWVMSKNVRISVAEAVLKNRKGFYDVFTDLSVAQIISRNLNIGLEVITEAYLGQHEGLILSGSKPIIERKGFIFIKGIENAKTLAKMCNDTLYPKLKEKYGPDVRFCAAHVDGTMSESEYKGRMKKLETGEFKIIFSDKKLGEGVDFPFVNFIGLLNPHGLGSTWELKQEIGRGVRLDPNDPSADLVVLDMVFESKRHLLASVLGIFGAATVLSGGLVAGWSDSQKVQEIVYEALRTGKSWTDIYNELTPEQRMMFPYIEEKMEEEKMRARGVKFFKSLNTSGEDIYTLESIDFIEYEDIRLQVSLGNQEEMMKYSMETLISLGYDSIHKLIKVRDHSLSMFALSRFDRFRDGLTMVNLNLQKNDDKLTARNMTEFIDVMRKAGMPEGEGLIGKATVKILTVIDTPSQVITRKSFSGDGANIPQVKRRMNSLEKQTSLLKKVAGYASALETLHEYTRSLFGKVAEFHVKINNGFKQSTLYTAQAYIQLPEGTNLLSTTRDGSTESEAVQGAAAEFHELLRQEIAKGDILLYSGSLLYINHRKALRIMIHENNFSDVIPTIIPCDGIYTVVATVKKMGFKFDGKPAMNRDEGIAKRHAEVMLAIELMKLPSFYYYASSDIGHKHFDELERFCKQAGFGTVKRINAKVVLDKKFEVEQVTLKAYGLEETALGVSSSSACERAAKKLLLELKKLKEQRTN